MRPWGKTRLPTKADPLSAHVLWAFQFSSGSLRLSAWTNRSRKEKGAGLATAVAAVGLGPRDPIATGWTGKEVCVRMDSSPGPTCARDFTSASSQIACGFGQWSEALKGGPRIVMSFSKNGECSDPVAHRFDFNTQKSSTPQQYCYL